MSSLTEMEMSTIKDVLNIGFSKAAETLSFFMAEKISIEAFDFKIEEIDFYKNNFRFKADSKYILTTKIIGEINGSCYLVFSKADTAKLFELGLPKNLIEESEDYKEMSKGLLLELDNIVSASVITQFANLLKCKMHGGVPSIWEMKDNSNAEKELFANNLDDSYILNFKSKFISSSTAENFSPEFIWVLTPTFVEKVKETIIRNSKTTN
ncbi:MAG: hypothetical protein A3F72_14515 [Bacteroidetes bacterium RIFCSPLOWO2_12_FULL_35_15]|nr:MAG: hypothetical protein A3F72_14515 [Bacteroidetes bacterium RIFCSPLOWO2_12_FULL_35_15]